MINNAPKKGFPIGNIIAVALLIAAMASIFIFYQVTYTNDCNENGARNATGAFACFMKSARESNSIAVVNINASLPPGTVVTVKTPETDQTAIFEVPVGVTLDGITPVAAGSVPAGGFVSGHKGGRNVGPITY